MRSERQRGVALVLTLILLSVITVIAVAFLAVARQERRSVEHSGYYTDTEQMALSAFRRAQAELIAQIKATTNIIGPGFIVSVNVDGRGVDGYVVPMRVTNITNLRDDARVPVFIVTNRTLPGSNDFRYYADLNRNVFFDETGLQQVYARPGTPNSDPTTGRVYTNSFIGKVYVSNYFTGDPQYLGMLADPRFRHSRTNQFLGRYAFLVVPIGQTLDLNTMYNDSRNWLGGNSPAFFRQQGVGPWEINLAALLADLNTNVWGRPYSYNAETAGAGFLSSSTGPAFADATDLLYHRYKGDITNLPTARQLFGTNVQSVFIDNKIDEFANGLGGVGENDQPDQPWPGADTYQHFFSLHDLWSLNNFPSFVARLRQASTNPSTYDRNTFYRLLSQVGTDSVPEEEDAFGPKVNLNYDNLNASVTNLFEWEPVNQFANIANRMLRDDVALSVDNIPVFTNMSTRATNGLPLYSARVHQLLQMAANITDATRSGTNMMANLRGEISHMPTVYQPIFEQRGSDVFIIGYKALDGKAFRTEFINDRVFWHDLNDPNDRPDGGTWGDNHLCYGVPMIVAARKGHPNFNECALQTVVQVTRKLELRKRPGANQLPNEINQMFILGVSSTFGVEAWNSYEATYPRAVQTLMVHEMNAVITNDVGLKVSRRFRRDNFNGGTSNVVAANTWAGRGPDASAFPQSFKIPAVNEVSALTNSVYYQNPTPRFVPAGPTNQFERNVASYTNRWGITLTNHLQLFMFEPDSGQLIDAVVLGDLNTHLDISDELNKVGRSGGVVDGVWDSRVFRDEYYGLVSQGVLRQIEISSGDPAVGDDVWAAGAGDTSQIAKIAAQQKFKDFLDDTSGNGPLVARAPFSPTKRLSQVTSWQVNDPLVHYRTEDLLDETNNVRVTSLNLGASLSLTNGYNIGKQNERYRPWGKERYTGGGDPNDMNPEVKDPGMAGSDNWNFPTNKFPNIGWLGRVHRGTPWQTIYMKSSRASEANWRSHMGAAFLGVRNPFTNSVRLLTSPTNDWRLFDHFTTAPHPYAERGKLSVNQDGLAAWSAVLSGVPVRRAIPAGMTNVVIEPFATGDNAVQAIVAGINAERAQHALGRFERVGDVLATPELTDASPFAPPSAGQGGLSSPLTDEEYEQVPQQIFSLLDVGKSRFAIFAFGQSLRPAANSIIASGPDRGLCTNYQITGESALRAIVRLDFEPLSLNPDDPGFNKPDPRKPHPVIESFNIIPIE